MESLYQGQAELPLLGGAVQEQRLVVPHRAVVGLTYRQACRLGWKLRRVRNLTYADLARQAGLYKSHVSDYFSVHAQRRELPAAAIGRVQRILGNTVISQWVAWSGGITVLDELALERRAA